MRHHEDGAVLHVGGRLWDREQTQFELRRAFHRWELVGEFNGLSPAQKESLDQLRSPGGMGPTQAARLWNIAKGSAHDRLEA